MIVGLDSHQFLAERMHALWIFHRALTDIPFCDGSFNKVLQKRKRRERVSNRCIFYWTSVTADPIITLLKKLTFRVLSDPR